MEKAKRPINEDLLAPHPTPSVLADLSLSLLQAGAVDPIRAVAQIIDQATGKSLNLDTEAKSAAKKFGYEPVKPAEFSSASWYAQQLGSAVGMMAPYLLARGAVTHGANRFIGDRFLDQIHKAGKSAEIVSKPMAKMAASEAVVAGTSGLLYGLFFVPAESTDKLSAFLQERFAHALYDGAAFGAIGAIAPYVGRGMGKLAGSIENAQVGKYGNSLKTFESPPRFAQAFGSTQALLAMAVRAPVLNGAISGIPIGLVNAEVGALKTGNWLPESKELKENVVAMIFVGSALTAVNRMAAPRQEAVSLDLKYEKPDHIRYASKLSYGRSAFDSTGYEWVRTELMRRERFFELERRALSPQRNNSVSELQNVALTELTKEIKEPKQSSPKGLGDISRVLYELDVPPTAISQLGDINAFAKWFNSKNLDLNSTWQRVTLRGAMHSWVRLPEGERKYFEKWMERHLLKNDSGNMPSEIQLQLLYQIVSKWDYFSKAERESNPAAMLEKGRTLSEMTLIPPNKVADFGATIPDHLAHSIPAMKPWKQIAALSVWHSLIAAQFASRPERTIPASDWNAFVGSKVFAANFEKRFLEEVAKGRTQILSESKDAKRIIQSYHPTMEPVFVEIVSERLALYRQPDSYVQRLNPTAFKTVLARLLEQNGEKVEQLSKMDPVESADHPLMLSMKGHRTWEIDSAIKLLTTFGAQWRSVNGKPGWLEKQQTLGRSAHDATAFLEVTPKASADSLAAFLMRFYDRDPAEIGVIAKRWENFSAEQRSAPYKEILAEATALKYNGTKHSGLAVEAARWGVEQTEFDRIQDRFVKTLETASPFPIERIWTVAELTARFIPRNDPRGLFLGRHTDCCQHVTHTIGGSAAWMGQERPTAGFFVIENKRRDVVAQSLVWEADNGGLIFDSIEGKGIGDRAAKIAELYEKAAADLKLKYHSIHVGNDYAAASTVTGLGRWRSVANEEFIKTPYDYAGYSDAQTSQLLLASNPQLKVREGAKTHNY